MYLKCGSSRSTRLRSLANGRIQKWRANRLERDLGPYLWDQSTLVTAACEDREGNLVIVEEWKLEQPKTKDFLNTLSGLNLSGKTLIVDSLKNTNLMLASRNVSYVHVATSDSLNTYQILRSDKLVFTRGAFEKIEHRSRKRQRL